MIDITIFKIIMENFSLGVMNINNLKIWDGRIFFLIAHIIESKKKFKKNT